ncbi:sulfurtransferase TusA family protein [Bauldia litoralis]|uniref:tRNA 2-thiouridine synthesizing protein A n=1 Tax=Bauldia litoralis TaxID=665467 RepID=A0A1G6BXW7_9HYPH|nr:sulfurtransferase TusA family protein [Bauldia litoralis]SDB25481.1 tRNA 2-thiouridine synthesizing protein A [Bauldia litoralis]
MTTRQTWDCDVQLDLRGLACPLPVLKTRKALLGLASGGRVLVEATDPLAAIDLPHFVREAGHRLVVAETVDGVYRCIVERA